MSPKFQVFDVGGELSPRQKAQIDSIMDVIGPTMARLTDHVVLSSIVGSVMLTAAMRFTMPGMFLDDARAVVDTALAEKRGEAPPGDPIGSPEAEDAAAVDLIGQRVALVLAECPNTNVLLDVISAMVSFGALKSGENEDFVGQVVACVMRVLAGHPPREAEDD